MTLVYSEIQTQFLSEYGDILSMPGKIVVDAIFNGVRRSGRTEAVICLLYRILSQSQYTATIFSYSNNVVQILQDRFQILPLRSSDRNNNGVSMPFPNGSILNVINLMDGQEPDLEQTNDMIVLDGINHPVFENKVANTVILIV